ncbi:hypothetical protein RPALISO_228 [Ruegeria phage RpAliso]|nr:hypothetical protein RPALISO_228 [Ruegeria phage RpAliso]
MANGAIIWEGASVIDGAPIVVVATGLKASSRNAKTGNLIQTWILRADVNPVEATHTGADESICGACPHRGAIVDGKNVGRSCYVTVFQAPRTVWKTYAEGKYARLSAEEAAAIFAGRHVRLGAYGDPAAVPFDVWAGVLADTARGTGYTHQWQNADPRFAQLCMASADSSEEAAQAQAMGYRTFRVGTFAEKAARGEFLCPASKEAGQKVNCAQCLACGGTDSPNKASVFIPAHGAKNKVIAFERRRES